MNNSRILDQRSSSIRACKQSVTYPFQLTDLILTDFITFTINVVIDTLQVLRLLMIMIGYLMIVLYYDIHGQWVLSVLEIIKN